MAWTTPRTWVAGAVLTAAQLNVDVRDNLGYLKGLLDGTGGATAVIVPDELRVKNDADFRATIDSNGPYWWFDSLDFLQYYRSTNLWKFLVNNVVVLQIDGNGKLTGNGYFTSAQQTITTGSSATVAHGLSARPRFVSGQYAPASGAENATSEPALVLGGLTPAGIATVVISGVDSANIVVQNKNAATRYVYVYAQL